jgi:hypothetical protein
MLWPAYADGVVYLKLRKFRLKAGHHVLGTQTSGSNYDKTCLHKLQICPQNPLIVSLDIAHVFFPRKMLKEKNICKDEPQYLHARVFFVLWDLNSRLTLKGQ